STSPGPGSGSGTSVQRRTSGPPGSGMVTAYTRRGYASGRFCACAGRGFTPDWAVDVRCGRSGSRHRGMGMERIRWYPLVVMSVVYAVLVGAAWAAWGRAASGGPLSDPGGAIESASVDVGGTVTFGDVILRNNGSGPIH